ncbi:MAG: toll/interleukin-1 receptor domain-containing protein [Solirubrobacteraceae bacterium]
MGGGGWDVFIAYPSAERAAADELYAALRRGGAEVFLDHECLRAGDPWPSTIAAAQRDARLTAVLVSKRSDHAFYQAEEIAQAIALFREDPERHSVVPVYLDDDADPPYGLRGIHALSASAAGGMADVALELLAVGGRGRGDGPAGVVAGTARATPVPSRRSPFRPGTPLYVSDFLPGASRRALVGRIASDVGGGTNVNLVGERRLGRTSTLNHVWGRLVADRRVVARVNLQDGVGSAEDFYGSVLWGVGQCPAGAELLGQARLAQLDSAPAASYGELRDALRNLRPHATAVVLVDEFERCFDLPDAFALPVFYDNLRSLLGGDGQGPYAMAVVATRQPLAVYFTRRQVTSTLPGYLPVRSLEALTAADAEELLAQDSPHRLGSFQRKHAAALAANHPCCLQCAGEAWYRALEAGTGPDRAEEEFRRLRDQVCIGAVWDGRTGGAR